ncbi:hypothetical protein L0Y69_01930 [bacterium]|nr:hypothetical protein [bacterium]
MEKKALKNIIFYEINSSTLIPRAFATFFKVSSVGFLFSPDSIPCLYYDFTPKFKKNKIQGSANVLPAHWKEGARATLNWIGGEPVFPFSAALRAAESIGKIPESLILVRRAGFEPA